VDIIIATGSTDLRIALELLIREEAGLSIVGTTSESEGLFALIETTPSDLVLLDWELAGLSCPQMLTKVHTLTSPPKIVVLGKHLSTEEAAIQAGADSFVLMGESPKQLLAAIREFDPKNGRSHTR
jgi:DNA-binding NarL/FixJ family response regulator